MNDQRPLNYGSSFMTWDQVPKETQAEVVRLAEAGQFHPDRDLRRLAYSWAAPVANEPTWSLCISVGLDLVSALGGPVVGFAVFRDRRDARSIAVLGDPNANSQR